jgi:hypothetical protein
MAIGSLGGGDSAAAKEGSALAKGLVGKVAGEAQTAAQKAGVAAEPALFHGSPNADLTNLAASQPTRVHNDNPVSKLGVFLTPDRNEAIRYAKGGKVYEFGSEAMPKKLYEMSHETYRSLEGAQGTNAMIFAEMHAEGLKKTLMAQGYDGIRIPSGTGGFGGHMPEQIIRFDDLPVSK